MKTLTAIVALLCALPVAEAKEISKTARAYVKTHMYTYAGYDSNCRPMKGVVKLVKNPTNGILMTKDEEHTIQSTRGREDLLKKCRGTPITGIRVDYVSSAGFKGEDRFQIEVAYGTRKPEVDTFIVNVE